LGRGERNLSPRFHAATTMRESFNAGLTPILHSFPSGAQQTVRARVRRAERRGSRTAAPRLNAGGRSRAAPDALTSLPAHAGGRAKTSWLAARIDGPRLRGQLADAQAGRAQRVSADLSQSACRQPFAVCGVPGRGRQRLRIYAARVTPVESISLSGSCHSSRRLGDGLYVARGGDPSHVGSNSAARRRDRGHALLTRWPGVDRRSARLDSGPVLTQDAMVTVAGGPAPLRVAPRPVFGLCSRSALRAERSSMAHVDPVGRARAAAEADSARSRGTSACEAALRGRVGRRARERVASRSTSCSAPPLAGYATYGGSLVADAGRMRVLVRRDEPRGIYRAPDLAST